VPSSLKVRVASPPEAADYLSALKQEMSPTDEADLIFPGTDGDIWIPGRLSWSFRRFADRHGFDIRFHDLRHTHASQLLALGVPVQVVQARLGHSTPTTTMSVYAHLLPGMQEDAISKLDEALK
jgi:integrase